MARFMIVTFALLGWAFFELSGGQDFEPPELAASPLNDLQQVVARDATLVARASTAPSQAPVAAPAVQIEQVAAPAASQPVAQPVQTSLAVVLGEAAQQVEPEPEVLTAVAADIRLVNGSRVNVRNGPGTNFSVVAQLTRGAEAEVLQNPGDGWVKIKAADTGGIGWMAERLLIAKN